LNSPEYPARKNLLRTVSTKEKRHIMLWTIAVILVVLWILGMVSSYTLGGLIHILLVLAIIAVVVNLLRGKKTL